MSSSEIRQNSDPDTDLQTRNLLLVTDPPISTLTLGAVSAYAKTRSSLVRVHPGELQASDVEPSIAFLKSIGVRFTGAVKLADFGSGFTEKEGGMGGGILWEAKAPERLTGSTWGLPADIWALGCTVTELATGRHLFSASPVPRSEFNADLFIRLIAEKLGEDDATEEKLRQELRTFLREPDDSEIANAELTSLEGMGLGMLRRSPSDRWSIVEVQRFWCRC